MILSAIFGASFARSFWGWPQRMDGIASWFFYLIFFGGLVVAFYKIKHWIYFLKTFVYISAFASVIVILGGRGSFFGNAGYVTDYLIFAFFLAPVLILFEVGPRSLSEVRPRTGTPQASLKNWWIVSYIISFLLISATIFQSNIQGTYVGILIGLIFLGIALPLTIKSKIKWFLWSGTAVFLLIILVALYIGGIGLFGYGINLNEQPVQSRLLNWQIAFEGFKQKPGFGWGGENYTVLFDKNFIPDKSLLNLHFDRPHNKFLEVLALNGIVGISAYLLLISAGFIGYFAHNLFLFDTIFSYIPFFITIAFVHFLNKNNAIKNDANIYELYEFSPGRNIFKTLALSAAAFIIFYVFVVNPYFSFSYSGKAHKIIEKGGDYKKASDLYKKSLGYSWFVNENILNLGFASDVEMVANYAIQTNAKKPDKVLEKLIEDVQKDTDYITDIYESKIFSDSGGAGVESYLVLSSLYKTLGKLNTDYYKKSRSLLERADEKLQRIEVSYNLIELYYGFGQKQKALEKSYDSLLKNPELAVSLWNYGRSLINYSDEYKKEGLKYLEKAIGDGFDYRKEEYLKLLAKIYVDLEDYEKALGYQEKLVEINPNDSNYRITLAVIYTHLGEKNKAQEQVMIISNMVPDEKQRAVVQQNLLKFLEGL